MIREVTGVSGKDPLRLGRVIVCGNTVMSHIFAGVSPASIGVAPFTPTEYFGKSYSAEMLGFQTVQPEEIYIAPCLSGYIGGDITADLLAIDGALREQPSAKDVLQRGPMLLMDIGTNSELALSTPEEIYCTSAPAGPAFEGAEISCGMGALPGAICRVQIGKDGKGAIVTLVERTTKKMLMAKSPKGKNAKTVARLVVQMLRPFEHHVLSITTDNGTEFAEHKYIARKLHTKVYFAHPYSSWEKGLIENTNKLIRQYIPNGTDFTSVSDDYILYVQTELNLRPRKLLNFSSPKQKFLLSLHNGVALGS